MILYFRLVLLDRFSGGLCEILLFGCLLLPPRAIVGGAAAAASYCNLYTFRRFIAQKKCGLVGHLTDNNIPGQKKCTPLLGLWVLAYFSFYIPPPGVKTTGIPFYDGFGV